MRELVRFRRSLMRERMAEVNRLHKVLEAANIKLSSVASDVTGKSGRGILAAMMGGESDPQVLPEFAKGQLRKNRHGLGQALQGRMGPHQHFVLVQLLTHIDYLDESIAQVEVKIAECKRPFQSEFARLQTAPGIKRPTAEAVWTALPDLSYFSSADHLASWAGLCPGIPRALGNAGQERHVRGLTLRGTP